jgi:hypothetical protein
MWRAAAPDGGRTVRAEVSVRERGDAVVLADTVVRY